MRSNECLHVAIASSTPPTTTPSSQPSTLVPSKSSSYTYSPLERDQIRLVVLESSSDPSDPLTCRLLACHRNDAPPYEAISHAPTDSHDALTSTTTIRVLPPVLAPSAPTTLAVPQSVASALLALRHADRPRTLWIDTLSIDAADTAERSAQVLLTPHIFHAAWRVVVPLFGDYAEAVAFVSRGRFRSTPAPMLPLLEHLFLHPWFSQTWSIPHIARSRAAFVLHESTLTPFTNFSLCARTLNLVAPITSPIRRLKQRGAIPTLTTTQFVKAVAEASACSTAADPRDRVFAFLPLYPALMTRSQIETYRTSGLAGGDERGCGTRGKARASGGCGGAVSAVEVIEDEKTRARMTDYRNDVGTVYTQFATLLLSDAGLDFLSTVQGRAEMTDRLPSWVPDWRADSGRTILAHLPLTEFGAGGHWGDQKFRVVPGEDGGRLEVSAVCVGEIAVLGDACDVRCDGWEEVVFRQWRAVAEDARRGRGSKECPSKVLEAFVQTIMTDSDEEHVDARKTLCRRLSVPEERRQVDGKALFEGVDEEAIAKLRISCHGRRLFVTSKGIMGLVASESKERDFVAVLPGARLPYSFRHRYDLASADVELVGECFVQGLMRGEAFVRGVPFVKRDIRIC